MAVAVIVAAFAMAWLTGKRSIADRIDALEAACQRVADGDLETRVSDTVSRGDLGRLGSMFDVMADRVAKREHELLVSRNMLRTLNHRIETACEEDR